MMSIFKEVNYWKLNDQMRSFFHFFLLPFAFCAFSNAFASVSCKNKIAPCSYQSCEVTDTSYPNQIQILKLNTDSQKSWIHFHGYRGARPEIDSDMNKIISHSGLIPSLCHSEKVEIVFPLSLPKNKTYDEFFVDETSLIQFLGLLGINSSQNKIKLSGHSGAGRTIRKILQNFTLPVEQVIWLDAFYHDEDIEFVQNLFERNKIPSLTVVVLASAQDFAKLKTTPSSYSPYNRAISIFKYLKKNFSQEFVLQNDQKRIIKFKNSSSEIRFIFYSDAFFDHWSLVPMGLKE